MKTKALVLLGAVALVMLLPVVGSVNAHLVNTNPTCADGASAPPPPFPNGFVGVA
jgi:hypothetical protein